MSISEIQDTVAKNAHRVASLGNWPPYIPAESLLSRIPGSGSGGPGFDAGIACALDLIPRNKQQLSATLHAAYTPKVVERVRSESKYMDPDSQTIWWLAACSVCNEGAVDQEGFLRQLEDFRFLASNPEARVRAARDELEIMQSAFETETYGFPHGTVDGCIHGAYLARHSFGTMSTREFDVLLCNVVRFYDLYFIGTYRASLGLEEFEWSDEVDSEGETLSGPVRGSRQFVKCKDLQEFLAAVEVVKRHLGD